MQKEVMFAGFGGQGILLIGKILAHAAMEEGFEVDSLKYIIGRGGLTYPLESGVYLVDNLMLKHASEGIYGQHASNLGPLIADFIANQIPGAKA